MSKRSPTPAPEGDPLPWRSARICLRRLRPSDLAAFQAYRRDPDVGRYQGWEPAPDAQASVFLRQMQQVSLRTTDVWLQLAIADAADDRLIGDIGLYIAAPGQAAEFGITLARDAQHRGLAAESVHTLIGGLKAHTAVRRLVAVTDTRNAPSARLLHRVGMTLQKEFDGTLRGEPCRSLLYALQW